MSTRLTAEDIANFTVPENVRISKDGKLVVYTLRNLTRDDPEPLKSAIWIAEVGREKLARELVPASSMVNLPAFRPDGKSVAFISNLALSVTSLQDPLDVIQLTTTAEHGYVSGFRWSSDGKNIIFNAQPSNKAAPSDVKVYGENLRYSNLWTVALDSQEVTRLMDETLHMIYFEPNVDGTKVYYCARDKPEVGNGDFGTDIRVLDIASRTSRLLHRIAYRVEGFGLSGETPVLRAPFDLDGGNFWHSPSIRVIDEDGNDVWHAYGEKNSVASLQTSWGQPAVFLQEGMRDSIRTMDGSVLFEATETITSYDFTISGEVPILTLIKDSTGVPPEVYSVAEGQVCQLSSHSKDVTQRTVATARIIEAEREGVPMSGFWSIPPSLRSDFGQKPLPTVVLVKGGPWGRVTNGFGGMLLHFAPYLLSQGYLVLQPNYRGGYGYGEAYSRAVNGNAAISYDDVIWHTKKGIADGIIDPKRIAIAGWSQGGYLTYLASVRDLTFHFTAAVAGAGISDWYLETMTSAIPAFQASLMGFKPWGVDVLKNHSLYQGSPIHHVKDVKTPVLILHGEDDPWVPVRNAQIFALAMEEYGKAFEMAIYPNEGHGLPFMWDRKHYVDLLGRLGRFLEKYMK